MRHGGAEGRGLHGLPQQMDIVRHRQIGHLGRAVGGDQHGGDRAPGLRPQCTDDRDAILVVEVIIGEDHVDPAFRRGECGGRFLKASGGVDDVAPAGGQQFHGFAYRALIVDDENAKGPR